MQTWAPPTQPMMARCTAATACTPAGMPPHHTALLPAASSKRVLAGLPACLRACVRSLASSRLFLSWTTQSHTGSLAHRNLARVDETRIDYDLLDDLVAYIHGSCDEGAILVFLPGKCFCQACSG